MEAAMIRFAQFAILFFFAASVSTFAQTFTPIDLLGTTLYKGFSGGLYPNGSNTPPRAHTTALEHITIRITPLDTAGLVSPNGHIVLLLLGASSPTQEFPAFVAEAMKLPSINPNLLFVNGGQGGVSLEKMNDTSGRYFENNVGRALRDAGSSFNQVSVIWLKTGSLEGRGDTLTFPDAVYREQEEFIQLLQRIRTTFPNLKVVYVTGRNTTQYVAPKPNDDGLVKHLEPRAYYNSWMWKWLIEAQMNETDPRLDWHGDDRKAPLVAWAAPFWTNGAAPNSIGHTWLPEDVEADGVHPSTIGEEKIGKLLVTFFSTDSYTKQWFLDTTKVSSAAPTDFSLPVWLDLQ